MGSNWGGYSEGPAMHAAVTFKEIRVYLKQQTKNLAPNNRPDSPPKTQLAGSH